jgi:hypothetical protein
MIPISEIRRVIEELKVKHDVNIDFRDYNTANAYETAMIMLEELIPSEPNNTSERVSSDTERT